MKKPASLSEFKTLIDNMEHRERFVFQAQKEVSVRYGQKETFIEVYNTTLFESKSQDRNITVFLVDFEGNPLNKKAKLHRLWNMDFYLKIYNNLAGENESDLIHKSSQVLELPE
jgi:hypothetical protein